MQFKFTTIFQQTRNSSGFSLISVMVATGLVSILAVSIMSMSETASKSIKYARNADDVNSIAQQVTGLFTVQPNCKNIYGGSTVDVTNIGAGATVQLDVSSRNPYPGMGAMTTLRAGDMRLISVGISLIRSLGPGQPWYQANAMVVAGDPANPGRYAPKKVPINVRLNATGVIADCTLTGATAGGGGAAAAAAAPGLPIGQCGPGQVMTGFTVSGGLACTGGGAVASGIGCTGDSCTTTDGGPCYGDSCRTNGPSCSGDSCTACGTAGSGTAGCTGDSCCFGPTCGGC